MSGFCEETPTTVGKTGHGGTLAAICLWLERSELTLSLPSRKQRLPLNTKSSGAVRRRRTPRRKSGASKQTEGMYFNTTGHRRTQTRCRGPWVREAWYQMR
eukprot:scaffold90810_cov36-Phaeocystis_antarctica.AAC.1